MAAPDPFVALSAGRSLFRVKDLLALASLVSELLKPADTDKSVKEISSDV